MPGERLQQLAAANVPDLHGLVGSGGRAPFAIRTEGDSTDPVGMAPQSGQGMSGVGVPDPNALIRAGGGHLVPIRTDSDTQDLSPVPLESHQRLGGFGVPYEDMMIDTSRDQPLAAAEKDCAIDDVVMPVKDLLSPEQVRGRQHGARR